MRLHVDRHVASKNKKGAGQQPGNSRTIDNNIITLKLSFCKYAKLVNS